MKTKDAEDEPLAGLFKPSFAMIPSASDGGVKAIEIDGEETLVLQGLWGQISSKKLSNIYAHGSTIYAKLKPAGGKAYLSPRKIYLFRRMFHLKWIQHRRREKSSMRFLFLLALTRLALQHPSAQKLTTNASSMLNSSLLAE
jgi:hypothetical protein